MEVSRKPGHRRNGSEDLLPLFQECSDLRTSKNYSAALGPSMDLAAVKTIEVGEPLQVNGSAENCEEAMASDILVWRDSKKSVADWLVEVPEERDSTSARFSDKWNRPMPKRLNFESPSRSGPQQKKGKNGESSSGCYADTSSASVFSKFPSQLRHYPGKGKSIISHLTPFLSASAADSPVTERGRESHQRSAPTAPAVPVRSSTSSVRQLARTSSSTASPARDLTGGAPSAARQTTKRQPSLSTSFSSMPRSYPSSRNEGVALSEASRKAGTVPQPVSKHPPPVQLTPGKGRSTPSHLAGQDVLDRLRSLSAKAPPNLRTSLKERDVATTKRRPGKPSVTGRSVNSSLGAKGRDAGRVLSPTTSTTVSPSVSDIEATTRRFFPPTPPINFPPPLMVSPVVRTPSPKVPWKGEVLSTPPAPPVSQLAGQNEVHMGMPLTPPLHLDDSARSIGLHDVASWLNPRFAGVDKFLQQRTPELISPSSTSSSYQSPQGTYPQAKSPLTPSPSTLKEPTLSTWAPPLKAATAASLVPSTVSKTNESWNSALPGSSGSEGEFADEENGSPKWFSRGRRFLSRRGYSRHLRKKKEKATAAAAKGKEKESAGEPLKKAEEETQAVKKKVVVKEEKVQEENRAEEVELSTQGAESQRTEADQVSTQEGGGYQGAVPSTVDAVKMVEVQKAAQKAVVVEGEGEGVGQKPVEVGVQEPEKVENRGGKKKKPEAAAAVAVADKGETSEAWVPYGESRGGGKKKKPEAAAVVAVADKGETSEAWVPYGESRGGKKKKPEAAAAAAVAVADKGETSEAWVPYGESRGGKKKKPEATAAVAVAVADKGEESDTWVPYVDEKVVYGELVEPVKVQISGWKLEDKTVAEMIDDRRGVALGAIAAYNLAEQVQLGQVEKWPAASGQSCQVIVEPSVTQIQPINMDLTAVLGRTRATVSAVDAALAAGAGGAVRAKVYPGWNGVWEVYQGGGGGGGGAMVPQASYHINGVHRNLSGGSSRLSLSNHNSMDWDRMTESDMSSPRTLMSLASSIRNKLLLEATTEDVVICSSIVHDLVYKAASIAQEKAASQHQDRDGPTVPGENVIGGEEAVMKEDTVCDNKFTSVVDKEAVVVRASLDKDQSLGQCTSGDWHGEDEKQDVAHVTETAALEATPSSPKRQPRCGCVIM